MERDDLVGTARRLLGRWPLARQVAGLDLTGLGESAYSERTRTLSSRLEGTTPVPSVSPVVSGKVSVNEPGPA